MAFLVDMPLSPGLAAWLRDQGQDAVHAFERGLARARDIEIIELARREGRTIVTADLDYPRLLALTKSTDPGLVLFRDGHWSDTDVIARMSDVLRLLTVTDIAHSVIVVERHRIRRRRLPLAE